MFLFSIFFVIVNASRVCLIDVVSTLQSHVYDGESGARCEHRVAHPAMRSEREEEEEEERNGRW